MTDVLTNEKLYSLYDISEWEEKKVCLEEAEIQEVLSDLEEGKNSILVQQCKMPFPMFIESYLSKYDLGIKNFNLDPVLGFKLYLLGKDSIKIYVKYIKLGRFKYLDKRCQRVIGKIKSDLMLNFDDIMRDCSSTLLNLKSAKVIRYIYISQYIDFETARKLHVRLASIFERDGVDGFTFYDKMDTLNIPERNMIMRYLGLYGSKNYTTKEISDELSIPESTVKPILNILLPLFLRPLGEFKHGLGLVDRDYRIDETREYRNKEFNKLSINARIWFIKRHLPETDRLILDSLSLTEEKIYIASKYMYDTPMQVAENLGIALATAKRYKGKDNL